MKEQILDIIKNHPKHYTILIKKNQNLVDWINQNTLVTEGDFVTKLYSAIHQISDICEFGNKKTISRYNSGFVNCGPANRCQCTKTSIAQNVKLTKSSNSPEKNTEINNKRKLTMREKYGVEYNSQRKDLKHLWIKPKISEFAISKLTDKRWLEEQYITNQRSTVDIAQELGVYYSTVASYCIQHGFSIRRRSNYSLVEVEISKFLDELNIQHELSDWTVLGNKELDIYIPKYKLGIEINGLYWHSFHPKQKLVEDVERHISKTKQAKSKEVELLHITDYEWKNKNEIIKSMISNKLGISKTVIGARKCQIRYISASEAKTFFDNNHIQGHVNANIYVGLEYQNDIVMAVSLGKNRFSKDNNLELYRLASKLHTQIQGGASKLIKHVRSLYKDHNIITYCDQSKSNGNVYEKIGFKFVRETGPGYFYTDGTEIISRYRSMKKNLAKWLPTYNSNLTETENMFNAGYRRYYDCGNLVFIY
jgi:G:T-mismatch repair DNA endonuclease (very short patch repair protein)